MTKSIIGNLFIGCAGLAAFGWFFGIFELIATALMNKSIFSIGKKVIDFEERVSFARENFVLDKIFETDSGKFKFVDNTNCVFRHNLQWFSFRVHTPFPLKGCIHLKDGVASIEGRLPLGPTLFFCAWLAGWTAGCIGYSLQESEYALSLIMFMFGWGVIALMYFTSVRSERKRLLIVYDEMKRHLRY